MTIHIAAVFGSPRRQGNTAVLLQKASQGATDAGASVTPIVLRDLRISPCLEIYGCKRTGRCVIDDDFHAVVDTLLSAQGIMLASPIFFYTVSAHTKILMDRCQSLWVKKYWIEKAPFHPKRVSRKGVFLSVGATQGKRLFDGVLLTVTYFFDTLDTELSQAVCFRGIDFEGDIRKHPEYLDQAYQAGRMLVRSIGEENPSDA